MGHGTPPPPPARYEESPLAQVERELRMQRLERRAREVETDRYFKQLLQEVYTTGCFKAFWRAMRGEEE